MNELYTLLIGYFTTLSNVRVIRANQNAPALERLLTPTARKMSHALMRLR